MEKQQSPAPAEAALDLDAGNYLFYLIMQGARRREATLARPLRALGLTVSQWRVLHMIHRLERCSMGELALFSAVDRTTLTRTVDQLCHDGHIRRDHDPKDRRRVQLALNPSGLALRDAAAAATRAIAKQQVAVLAPGDHAAARRALSVLVEAMIPDPHAAREVLAIRRLARGGDEAE
jgi:DNA-binding MarR family transcriptional regulator